MTEYGKGSKEWLDANPGYAGGAYHHSPGADAPGTVGPPNFDNTAEDDPGYNQVLGEMWRRFRGDAGAGQAIDLAGGKIREAGIGAGKELGASLAARGVSGTGAETLGRTKLAGQVQGSIAGAASDIANQREREKDAELASIGGVVGGKAAENRANRELALRQWEGVRADQRAGESAQSAQQLAILQLLQQAGQSPFETQAAGTPSYPVQYPGSNNPLHSAGGYNH